jgi:hypothetical protein
MFLRSVLIIGFLLLTTGCLRSTALPKPIPKPIPSAQVVPHAHQQTRPLGHFTQVDVRGVLNVNLHTGYQHPKVILRGDPRDLVYVTTSVKNGLLWVSLGSGYPRFGAVSVEVDAGTLNALTYHGVGTITGSQLHMSRFDLVLENPGRTALQGQIGLRKLDIKGPSYVELSEIHSPLILAHLSGNPTVKLAGVADIATLDLQGGRFSLYWVKSRELTVRGRGTSFIQLAGVADRLDVELWESAHFNGRYLRAKRSFVKTHNQSVADISAVDHQHTLARDKSDIHFYNIPVTKSDFMANNGAVLDFRDLGLPLIQEYDQYNK